MEADEHSVRTLNRHQADYLQGQDGQRSPRDAIHLGIGMVHQRYGIRTAVENIVLGYEAILLCLT